MQAVNNEVLGTVARLLQERYGFSTKRDLDLAVADVVKRTAGREARGNTFSISKMIRGLAAREGKVIAESTREDDLNYLKALDTASTPGSYLVPTMQASDFIEYLSNAGILRAMGPRIWPMSGIQKLNIPMATAAPSVVWTSQTSATLPSDASGDKVSFDLKERRALSVVSNQLLKTSVPAFDTLLTELMATAMAESEDEAFFAASSVAGAPAALYAIAGTSKIHANSNGASGGNLLYTDILAVLAKMASVKGRPPYVWAMSGRTFYQRVLGLLDLQSRPLAIPTGVSGLAAPVAGTLMGFPVYICPAIPETMALSSGSNLSYALLINPRYLHLADGGSFEVAVSTERYFESNETAVRCTHEIDWSVAPAAGAVILDGIA